MPLFAPFMARKIPLTTNRAEAGADFVNLARRIIVCLKRTFIS